MQRCDVRHDNDGEIQPVPGVPQEGEGHDAESSGKDLDGRLKRVNGSERVPEGDGDKGGEAQHPAVPVMYFNSETLKSNQKQAGGERKYGEKKRQDIMHSFR